MNDDYKQGYQDGWKDAMEFVRPKAATFPQAAVYLESAIDPCEGCKPSPDAVSWVCGNAACPKRTKITCEGGS